MYGLSWQVVPTTLLEPLKDHSSDRAHRAMEAMLRMKKIDINELERAAAATDRAQLGDRFMPARTHLVGQMMELVRHASGRVPIAEVKDGREEQRQGEHHDPVGAELRANTTNAAPRAPPPMNVNHSP
jgi:hypothetical protein